MCSAYIPGAVFTDVRPFIKNLKIDAVATHQSLDATTYPYRSSSVIVDQGEGPLFTVMRYSMTPAWAAEAKVKWATHNARLSRFNPQKNRTELIFEAPTWRGSFGKKHVVVPIHSFFEGCRTGEAEGFMVEFKPEIDSDLLFAAGIYDTWVDKQTGEEIQSFAILTRDPSEFIQRVGHERSPVFIKPDAIEAWLKPFASPKTAYEFLEKNAIHPEMVYIKTRTLKSKRSTSPTIKHF